MFIQLETQKFFFYKKEKGKRYFIIFKKILSSLNKLIFFNIFRNNAHCFGNQRNLTKR